MALCLSVVLSVTGCTSRASVETSKDGSGTPAGASSGSGDTAVASGSIVVAPDPVRAGAMAELTFSPPLERGISFDLQKRSTAGWRTRFQLLSDGGSNRRTPEWHPADEAVAVEAVGVTGPGPDRVTIPSSAQAGNYRLCVTGQPTICGELTVTEG